VKATGRLLAVLIVGCAPLLPANAQAGDSTRPSKPTKATTAFKAASKGGSRTTRSMDMTARRAIGGGPTSEDDLLGVESPELRALRSAEQELFPPVAPVSATAWPPDSPLVFPADGAPRVRASGVPPSEPTPLLPSDNGTNWTWLAKLELPDLPVRWDDRVLRYLEFFRDDQRGHATFAILFRHSGRFRDSLRRTLRQKSLPEDLVWVAMIESGFDAAARSVSGAAGLWQFMPETARIYGLAIDRWLDQRYNVELETAAATDLLGDLRRRFGTWELAMAAYNMGHAGLASVIRRYNTNDFWSLARTEGALPWETTLYVPKVLAASVIAHNLAAFGFGDLVLDAPIETDPVDVAPGTPLSLLAQVVGCDSKEIESLNPELRTGRTPPGGSGEARYPVKVPRGKGAALEQALRKLHKDAPMLDRYVVRFGETLEEIAASRKTTAQKLAEMNAIAPGETVRGGTVLFVPPAPAGAAGASSRLDGASKPSVVVPFDEFVYPDRRRVFYRVVVGDTLKEVASALRVSVEDLCRWNEIDGSARLQEGMSLQAFVAPDVDLSHIAVLTEADVRVLPVGSDEFFGALEQSQGFRRMTVTARAGDTLESIGRRYDVSVRLMERINRRSRTDTLRPGETVIVYWSGHAPGPNANNATASSGPLPNGPLPTPPLPDLLP
jgi:membrane-bound lytic murein transglycosylase D